MAAEQIVLGVTTKRAMEHITATTAVALLLRADLAQTQTLVRSSGAVRKEVSSCATIPALLLVKRQDHVPVGTSITLFLSHAAGQTSPTICSGSLRRKT